MRRLALAAVLTCLPTMPRPALAESAPSSVVLLELSRSFSAEAWPEAELRARAELSLFGLSVIPVDSAAGDLAGRMAELRRVAVVGG